MSVFVVYVEATIYLLLYNLHHCIFKEIEEINSETKDRLDKHRGGAIGG